MMPEDYMNNCAHQFVRHQQRCFCFCSYKVMLANDVNAAVDTGVGGGGVKAGGWGGGSWARSPSLNSPRSNVQTAAEF